MKTMQKRHRHTDKRRSAIALPRNTINENECMLFAGFLSHVWLFGQHVGHLHWTKRISNDFQMAQVGNSSLVLFTALRCDSILTAFSRRNTFWDTFQSIIWPLPFEYQIKNHFSFSLILSNYFLATMLIHVLGHAVVQLLNFGWLVGCLIGCECAEIRWNSMIERLIIFNDLLFYPFLGGKFALCLQTLTFDRFFGTNDFQMNHI